MAEAMTERALATLPWSVEEVLADLAPGWWDSIGECNKAEALLRAWRVRLNDAMQRGAREEIRDRARDLLETCTAAIVELRQRKTVLASSDDAGRIWKMAFVREVKARCGEAAFTSMAAVAQAEVDRLMVLRAAPMAAGSVLAPIGSGGGARRRKVEAPRG